ncbi:MAG TPA: leucyl aminopeptidase [Candidatus Moranbacteria bacterium]|nr:leucyl aminopeptidase [Candidatus Moranbacteria bacterium]
MKIVVKKEIQEKNDAVRVLFSEKIPTDRFLVKGGRKILEIKNPEKKKMNRRKWIIWIRGIIQTAKKHKIEKLSLNWNDLIAFENIGDELGRLFAENVLMADYEFRKYKKEPKEGWSNLKELSLIVNDGLGKLRAEILAGVTVAEKVNFCRDLANMPGGDMTPEILARETRKAVRRSGIKMKVLDEKQIKQEKMGGVLAVGKGSQYKPKFIILEYWGDKKSNKPTILVGKGVTFDSGGIDTKPHPHALDMMMDMSGGAATIATLLAVAKMKLKRNVVALVPAVENMPSGSALRPGDIVKMMDGTMVEIGHTDAEGRLILADALVFAKRYKPQMVIDVATLTGAALTALGERANAVFTNDEDLAKQTEKTAEQVGDYVWRLPLWEEYESDIKGNFAEISNINTKAKPGYGSSITAATFLKHFAKDFDSWMHIDIAPRMTAVYDENLAKGATGTPVKLLVKLLEKIG